MKRRNKIDGISMKDFVEYYLGTKHECTKLKHQGLKSFDNPYVIGISNDFALKNPDYIIRNELIVVIDDYGNPGTYINPDNIKKIIELEQNKEKLRILTGIDCHSFEEAALLYDVWSKINEDIIRLEKLYGGIREIFRLTGKYKMFRNIKKYAIQEARRTFIFEICSQDNYEEEKLFDYDDSITNEDDKTDVIYYDQFEDCKVTEKVNRQRRLLSNRRIG